MASLPTKASEISLSSDVNIATAGYYQLSWQGQKGDCQLYESNREDFAQQRMIYHGSDMARVMSGKPDGDYYYRIRLNDLSLPVDSNIVKVTVRHHPLTDAFLFFTVGAVVFIATLILILKGNRSLTQ